MFGNSVHALKCRAIFLLVVCCCAVHADAQELPLLGQLPQLGPDWVLQKQGWFPEKQEAGKKPFYEGAWATFTNSKTGDIMSFAADRYANGTSRTLKGGGTEQSASEMFPGGLPRFMHNFKHDGPLDSGWDLVDEIRSSVITIQTGMRNAAGKYVKAKALQYSYVYESKAGSAPNRLAHGYVLDFGGTAIFIQHTSAHVITSDDAMGVAMSVLRNHPSSGLKQ